MALIIGITIILFLVLIGWTWSNLDGIDKNKKVAYIVISIIIIWLITMIIFNISKGNLIYEKQEIETTIGNLLIPLFTALNGFVVIQYIARIVGKLKKEEFTKKQVTNRIAILIVVFLVILILECGYMEDIQHGILNMYQLNK